MNERGELKKRDPENGVSSVARVPSTAKKKRVGDVFF